MAAFLVTDKNGSPYSMDINAVGGNYAPTVVWADSAGNKLLNAPGGLALPVSDDTSKAGYCYSGISFAPVAAPTDIIQIQGSATKTIRIKRIRLGGVATAAGNMPAQLIRRSAADSGGGTVLTAITAGKLDTTDAAATAVISTIGTANPGALGAAVGGVLRTGRVQMTAVGTGLAANELVWEFGKNSKAAVLRGVADFLCINLNGAAIPAGGLIDWEILEEEDAS